MIIKFFKKKIYTICILLLNCLFNVVFVIYTNSLKKNFNIFLIEIKINRLLILLKQNVQYYQTKFLIITLIKTKHFEYKHFAANTFFFDIKL